VEVGAKPAEATGLAGAGSGAAGCTEMPLSLENAGRAEATESAVGGASGEDGEAAKTSQITPSRAAAARTRKIGIFIRTFYPSKKLAPGWDRRQSVKVPLWNL